MTQSESEARSRAWPKRLISLGRAQIAGLACLPLLVVALAFAAARSKHGVLAGVWVGGIDLSDLSAEQATKRLDERARAVHASKLALRVADQRVELSAAELGLSLAPAASAQRALAVGRSGRVLADVWRYVRSLWVVEQLPFVVQVDAAKLEQALATSEPRLITDPPFPGGFELGPDGPRAVPPRTGRALVRDAGRSALVVALASGQLGGDVVLPTRAVTHELAAGSLQRCVERARALLAADISLSAGERSLQVTPAELAPLLTTELKDSELVLLLEPARLEQWLSGQRAAFEAPPRDASFTVSARDEVQIVPGEPGVRLVAEDVAAALWAASTQPERRGELPLRREPQPARTTEQAEQLGIKQLVGSFTTRHPCCEARVANIHRIAELMDGLVVEPGQTVSVNAVVGPRTQKNGFVPAPSIEEGEMVDTVGGGVSQFATTLFNALFHAGYDIVERQPHSYWFPRYPMAHEATLSWPKPDVIFKNDTSAGLLVKTSVTKTSVTVKLYGDTQGRKVTSSVSERRDIVKPGVELLPNRDIEPDKEKVKEGGMIGWSVIASRTVTFADGTKKEEKRKVTYKPKVRRVEVHPCRIPDGEPGATGEPCPEPEDAEQPADAEQQAQAE